MAVKAESTLQAKLRKHLERHGVYVYKTHGGPMQRAGMPDLCCVAAGVAVYVEVKMPGEGLTKLQAHRFRELRAAGAICLVASHIDDLRPITLLMENAERLRRFIEPQAIACGVPGVFYNAQRS